jgi:hypothetical protein
VISELREAYHLKHLKEELEQDLIIHLKVRDKLLHRVGKVDGQAEPILPHELEELNINKSVTEVNLYQ